MTWCTVCGEYFQWEFLLEHRNTDRHRHMYYASSKRWDPPRERVQDRVQDMGTGGKKKKGKATQKVATQQVVRQRASGAGSSTDPVVYQ